MARLACVLLLVAFRAWGAQGDAYSPSPHAIDIPKWFTESFLDLREDIRDAARQKKRLLVYFGQDGCPYCKALMKVNFGQPDIVATTRRGFTAIALNLWGDREVTWIDGRKMTEKELGRVLAVQFTPTILFFDEEGTVVLRLNGYAPPDKFRAALAYVDGRVEKRQSYTDFIAGRPPEKAAAKLADEPFFERGTFDLARLAAAGKPVIVVFERKHCADCDELHRDAFARPEVRSLIARFSVVQLDLATERERARSMRIVYTPTLVFLDARGKEVFRAEGFLRPFHLASALDYVASGAYRDEPSFQRFIQKRADAQRAAGRKVDLWE